MMTGPLGCAAGLLLHPDVENGKTWPAVKKPAHAFQPGWERKADRCDWPTPQLALTCTTSEADGEGERARDERKRALREANQAVSGGASEIGPLARARVAAQDPPDASTTSTRAHPAPIALKEERTSTIATT